MKFNRRQMLSRAGSAVVPSALEAGVGKQAAAAPLEMFRPFVPPGGYRSRVLYLNDLSGDIDGLFATVHTLLSTSTDLRGIVGTGPGRSKGMGESASHAAELA